MRAVAFFRNVNQGQRGHPSTAELVDAFAVAGCRGAVPVRSNGTVVFEADDPDGAATEATDALAARLRIEREVFVLPLTAVDRIARAHADAVDAARRELTLHGGGRLDPQHPPLVHEANRRRLAVLETGDGWVVSLNERDRESQATPAVERATGGPATSRGIPTLRLIIARFARP
jgi:uncharacterized protein (DUF1697 family)